MKDVKSKVMATVVHYDKYQGWKTDKIIYISINERVIMFKTLHYYDNSQHVLLSTQGPNNKNTNGGTQVSLILNAVFISTAHSKDCTIN